MYRGDRVAKNLLNQYRVDYVVIGPPEIREKMEPNLEFYINNFPILVQSENYYVFKIRWREFNHRIKGLQGVSWLSVPFPSLKCYDFIVYVYLLKLSSNIVYPEEVFFTYLQQNITENWKIALGRFLRKYVKSLFIGCHTCL